MPEQEMAQASQASLVMMQQMGIMGAIPWYMVEQYVTGKTKLERMEEKAFAPVEEWIAEGEERACLST